MPGPPPLVEGLWGAPPGTTGYREPPQRRPRAPAVQRAAFDPANLEGGSPFFLLHFSTRYGINGKYGGGQPPDTVVYSSDERENNEFAHPRERRPPAESRLGACRLVRPGAAVETRPEAPRYRGVERAPDRREFGWYRGRVCLSSQSVGRRAFFIGRALPRC